MVDYAGNTLATAREINPSLGTPQVFADRVDLLDTNDYYRLTYSNRSSLSLTLTGLSGNANLQLLNSSGTVIQSSSNTNGIADALNTIVDAGTYYIRVFPGVTGAETNYNLTVSTSQQTNIYWRDYTTGTNSIWLMGGTNNTAMSGWSYLDAAPSNWVAEATADFNGDGTSDIVWRDPASGVNSVWFMGGTTNPTRSGWSYLTDEFGVIANVSANWSIEGVADFNGDNRPDLLWRDSTSGANSVWFLGGTNNTTRIGWSYLPSAATEWMMRGVDDFNGDNRPDIVWRNRYTGTNSIWFMGGVNNTSLASWSYLSSAATNWSLAGIADFNGDNRPDLMWRDYATGTNSVWFMGGANNTSLASWSYLPSASSNWRAFPSNSTRSLNQMDIAGNTLSTALNIGILNGNGSFNDFVNSSDPNDYYQFTLTGTGNISLSLGSLQTDADVRILNSSGTVLYSSTSGGNASESINASLNAGTYYVQVYQYSGNTGYNLNLSATTAAVYKYNFTYYYNGSNNSSDYYTGYVYANAGTYTVNTYYDFNGNTNEVGYNGKYYITSSSLTGTAADLGKVTVSSYYDTTSGIVYTPYTGSGTNYLGSESGYLTSNYTSGEYFGGDTYEANPPVYRYNFTYYYNGSSTSSDYYTGYVYAYAGTYTVNTPYDFNSNPNQTGANGKYSITSSSLVTGSVNAGYVYVTTYYDVDSAGYSYSPYWANVSGSASGYNKLGSEYDCVVVNATNYWFGQDYYELDIPVSRPDLRGSFFDSPEPLSAGSSSTINFRIQNAGTASAAGFRVAFYLSTDSTITTGDRLLNTYDIASLATGATTSTLSSSFTLPGGTDTFWSGSKYYYIGMVIDSLNAISESNETNNASLGNGTDWDDVYIIVPTPQADLRGYFFDAAESLNAGSSYTANFRVQNAGTANAAGFRVAFYLSTDGTITTGDRLLSTYDIASLSAGGITNTLSSTFTLPGATDTFWSGSKYYYIGMIVDSLNAISESNETNNANLGNGTDWDDVYVTVSQATPTNPGITAFSQSGNTLIDSLLYQSPYSYKWDTSSNGGIVTYSFYQSTSGGYSGPEIASEVSSAVKGIVRDILAKLGTYINAQFVEVADTASNQGVMRFMYSSGQYGARYAHAYGPSTGIGGDVHLNPTYESDWTAGVSSYGYMAIFHEVLHAMGLKHPGNYDGAQIGDVSPFLSPSLDNSTNTIMTYNAGQGDTRYDGAEAITPMAYDIRALQYLYGARSYNASSTSYAFSTVYGYSVGGQLFGSTTTQVKQCLWDSGGTDTLDFSALSTSNSYYFDMNEGGILTTQATYNSVIYYDYAQDSNPNDWIPQGPQYVTSGLGTTIAYNSVIENLVNSRSNDIIIANSGINTFSGYTYGTNTGNDVLYSTNAADILNLSSYGLANLTTTINGTDLNIGLGTNGSILIKNYYGASGSLRTQIGSNYYRFTAGSWVLA